MENKNSKKGRTTTSFLSNVTASLSLAIKTAQTESDFSVAATYAKATGIYLYKSIHHLFHPASVEQIAPRPSVKVATKKINDEMELLETTVQKILQEKKSIDEEIKKKKELQQAVDKTSLEKSQTLNHEVDELLVKKIELVPELIKEHAARRVDLFFYLLIAVYRKNVIISKDKTLKQHGQGSKTRGTMACHSSLFPNIKITDEKIKNISQKKLISFLDFTFSTQFVFNPSSADFLAGTYFKEDVLNATVELPNLVNDFDGHMEGRFQYSTVVNACLAILNQVSQGTKNPRQGMNEFFEVMAEFFHHTHYENILKPLYASKAKELYFSAFKKVWEYEKAGTFSMVDIQVAANKKVIYSLNDHYIYSLLRPQKITWKEWLKNEFSHGDFLFLRLQAEMLNAKSSLDNNSHKNQH